MPGQKTALILLRLGIAFTFFYAAIFSFLNPNDWIGFFPMFLRNIFSAGLMLAGFSFYELALGFWLFSGKYSFLAAIASATTLLGIIVFNFGAMGIIFRDVAILFSALTLAVLSYKES